MTQSKDKFVVICYDDRQEDEDDLAHYVLATRQVFAEMGDAYRYADTIAKSRKPLVIPGRWHQLRPAGVDPEVWSAAVDAVPVQSDGLTQPVDVRIVVDRCVVQSVAMPKGVRVTVVDYDLVGSKDDNGKDCLVTTHNWEE